MPNVYIHTRGTTRHQCAFAQGFCVVFAHGEHLPAERTHAQEVGRARGQRITDQRHRGRRYLRNLQLQVADTLVGRLQLASQHIALCHCRLQTAPRVAQQPRDKSKFGIPLPPAPALAVQHTQHAHPLRPACRPTEEAGPVRAQVVDAKGPSRGLLHGYSRVHLVSALSATPAPCSPLSRSQAMNTGSTERTSTIRHLVPAPDDMLPRRAVRTAIHALAPFTAERHQHATRRDAHRGIECICAQDADARTDLPTSLDPTAPPHRRPRRRRRSRVDGSGPGILEHQGPAHARATARAARRVLHGREPRRRRVEPPPSLPHGAPRTPASLPSAAPRCRVGSRGNLL